MDFSPLPQEPDVSPEAPFAAGVTNLTVALVNFMPGEAHRQTEQQFRGILADAAGRLNVTLRCGAPEEALQPGTDGFIVTGMPPRAASLKDEPNWAMMTGLVDFAREKAVPAIWSCLAAHAAVLYLDGIERRRLPEKLSGVVACARTQQAHPLLAGLPECWRIPHSRFNEVPADSLRAAGYRILSQVGEGQADIFVKQAGALQLFCQGHPEYDAHSLLREYRRDIQQFLTGARDTYPAMPLGYFDDVLAARLEAFRACAMAGRSAVSLAAFPTEACEAALVQTWRPVAVTLYRNWLLHLADHKNRRART
jgi:homoserine O-succinyltransferase